MRTIVLTGCQRETEASCILQLERREARTIEETERRRRDPTLIEEATRQTVATRSDDKK